MNNHTNMAPWSAETMETLRKMGAPALERLAKGDPVEAILSDEYCKLPDKSAGIGRVMASQVLDLVDDYEQHKDRALSDKEKWIDEFLDDQTKDKELTEICRERWHLLQSYLALEEPERAAEFQARAEAFDESLVSEEFAQELLNQLKTAMLNSTLGPAQLERLSDSLKDRDKDLASAVVDFGKNDREVKAILSMVAYVNANQGKLLEIPPEATLEMVVPCVCFNVDATHVAAQVEAGEVSAEEGANIIQTLGTILGGLLSLALWFAYMIFGMVLIYILPTLLSLAVIPLLLYVAYTYVENVVDFSVDFATAAVNLGWKVGKGAATLVYRGASAIVQVCKEYILPAAKAAIRTVVDWVRRVFTPAERETEVIQYRDTVTVTG